MKLITRLALALGLAAGLAGASAGVALAQDKPDVLVTSSGQALDAFTVKTLLGRAGVQNDYDPLATASDLDGRKALVIAFGASVKGFGAAGITTETEIVRTRDLLDAAKAAGVRIVGVHIGGAERRQGLSEQFVQLVSPEVDRLVVWDSGNKDGYFDKVAAEHEIPLTLVGKLGEVGDAVAQNVTAE